MTPPDPPAPRKAPAQPLLRTEAVRKAFPGVQALDGVDFKKVCDAYATFKANLRAGNYGPEGSKRRVKAESKPIRFREESAQPYDDRMLTWNRDGRTVSVWTVAGRLKGIPFVCSEQAMGLLASRKGESDLVMREGMVFLIANIATTSDGTIMSGRQVNRYRQHKRDLRTKLQKKRTKSAARVLKRQRHKEARYATQRNHIIAKKLVHTAERTSRGIGLEDLTGIRQRVTAKKDQRARLHSWAFAQLGTFVEYKARRAGVPVVHVDPRHTSRQCSECRHTHRSNRMDQARFVCRSCGTVLHADHNSSSNIAHRADAVWQRGAVNRPRTP